MRPPTACSQIATTCRSIQAHASNGGPAHRCYFSGVSSSADEALDMLNRMMLLVVAVGGAALSPFILQRPTERALEQPVHAPVMQVGRRHFPVVLPEREFVALRTDLFAARESAVQADPKPAESVPIAAASAPPMPYRFVGTLLQNNRLQWFLAKAD